MGDQIFWGYSKGSQFSFFGGSSSVFGGRIFLGMAKGEQVLFGCTKGDEQDFSGLQGGAEKN